MVQLTVILLVIDICACKTFITLANLNLLSAGQTEITNVLATKWTNFRYAVSICLMFSQGYYENKLTIFFVEKY